MKLEKIIQGSLRETGTFPRLFVPYFFTALLSGVLGSDLVLTALGPTRSLIIRLVILLVLTPVAAGMTIFLDREIHSGKDLSLPASFNRVKPKYFTLIGVNVVAWTGILLGFLLFIVPGIFLYVKFIFTNQVVLLGEETDLAKALERSWNRTTNRWGFLFKVILIFEVPLLFISFSLGGLPPGWGATVSVILSTAIQTWVTLVITHIYLKAD